MTDLHFLTPKENLIFMGTVGTGKTHLATAIALKACQEGRKVRFSITGCISESDASTLLADLIENALIAAKHSQHKKVVQVKLGVDAGIFYSLYQIIIFYTIIKY